MKQMFVAAILRQIGLKPVEFPSQSAQPKPKSRRTKCSVSGATLLMLRVSRLCGIAPVKLEQKRGVWFVSVSPALQALSFVAITTVNIVAFTGLFLDLQLPPQKSNRASSPTRRFVWTTDFTFVMMNMSVAAYRAPGRMADLVICLDLIQKMKASLGGYTAKMVLIELKKCCIFAFSAVGSVMILVTDYYNFIVEVHYNEKDKNVAAMYSCYFVGFMVMFFMETQFVYTALEMYRIIRNINHCLDDVAQRIRNQKDIKVLISNNYMHEDVPVKSISKIVDSMVVDREITSGFKNISSLKTTPETIRHLALLYEQACGVMRRMNSCFGTELLVIIMSCFLHLVITPYNMINTIANQELHLVLMQGVWCGWHFFCTTSLVEPAHMTQVEIDRTRTVIGHLMLRDTDDDTRNELMKFYRFLLLNKVDFSPMGACVLSRSLVVSMVGSIATYLVIIIQFQSSES